MTASSSFDWSLLVFFAGCYFVAVAGVSVNLPVWEQTATISEYIYKREIPAITGFTMCMWFKGTNPTRTSDHPISISNQVTDNEVRVYFRTNDQLSCDLQGTVYNMDTCDNTELNSIMLNWNKQCYTWTSGGTFSWYVTYNDPDTLEVYRSVSTGSHSLRSSMNLILFQEQDSEMGSLNVNQGAEGKVAWFNFWDHELTSTELNALSCGSEGNLFTMTDMLFEGAGHFTHTDSFECSDDWYPDMPVWQQTATISEYLYKRDIPELTGFTMCMWFKGTNPTRTGDYPISISNQVTDNEVLVYFGSQNQLTFYLQGTNYHTPVCDANELDGIMLNWNKQCYAWTSGGTFSWYVTYNDPDKLEVYRSIGTGSHTLRPSMNLILFQEQDSEMGSLSVGQVTEAKVAWFNFWDYELSATQLNALTCESVGNLFTITDMMFAGAGHFTYTDSFECGVEESTTKTCTKILPVYEQTATLSEYIYKREIPELTGFTMCMWYKGTNPTRSSDHPISISNQVTDNEVRVYFRTNDQLSCDLQGTIYHMNPCESAQLDNIMLNWNKQCFAWTSGGSFKWYVTYNSHDNLEVYRSVSTGSHSLRSSMNLILLQEQDSEMGSLTLSQNTEAKISWFNFWDYELTSTQLNALNCESVGNLFSLSDMSFYGPAHFTYTDSFECVAGVKKPLNSFYTRRMHQKTMCKIIGAKLSNHVLTTVTTNSPALCVAKCTSHSECMSANYNLDDGACDLNSIEGRDYVGVDDFADDSASNFLYFSSLDC